MVVDEKRKLLGILEESQFAKIRNERQWEQPVAAMMRAQIDTVHPSQSLREALKLMSCSQAGFLPVVEDGILVGQITRADIILSMYDF